ncbi:MAG: tail fiber protein [Zoogloeaceae bacterium]|nr:tail fiber protein [Zoogloeaceae bacterium]
MHLIDGAGHVNNTFVAEDAATHRPPTEITAAFMNTLQFELANFLEWAGIPLNKADNAQLRTALVNSFSRKGSTIHYMGDVWTIVDDTEALNALTDVPINAFVIVTEHDALGHGMAQWDGLAWNINPLEVHTLDLYATLSDNHGFYWFSNRWNQFDMAALQVDEATEQDAGILRFATLAETLAGIGLNMAVHPAGLAAYAKTIVPTGSVFWFAAPTSPAGYLACNGALLSRAVYADLFAAIGTTFGSGDDETTFALPDLRGEFIRGWDGGRGEDAGRVFGSAQGDAFRSHTHNITYYHSTSTNSTALYPRSTVVATTTGILATAASGGTETRPRNIALLPCIKY